MGSFDLKDFKKDEVKELDGVWAYFDVEETQGVLVARAFNDKFTRAFRKLPRGLQAAAKMQTISRGADKKVWYKLLSETVLLDWKGISDEGKVLKYSTEAAAAMMMKYKDFAAFVWEVAGEEHLYNEEQAEEDEKNSPASSASV